MRITELDLKSFGPFDGLTLPMDASKVLIAGVNGAGKSNCREAIRWALTGRCAVTDGRGAGAEHLVPQGGSSISVGVKLHGIGQVLRTRRGETTTFSVEGMTGDASAQQVGLFYKLQTRPEFLDAVLETEHFLRLHHGDAKNLVLGLLAVKVTVGDVIYSLDELDAQYDAYFAERKVAKAKVKGLHVPPMPTSDPTSPMPAVAVIEEQLALRRSELTAAAGNAGELAGKRQGLERRIAQVEAMKKVSIRDTEIDSRIAEAHAKVTEIESALNVADLREALPTLAAPKAGDPKRVVWLRETIPVLDKHQPTKGCVLDAQVSCETHRNKFVARIKVLRQELNALGGVPTPVPATFVDENPHLAALKVVQDDIRSLEAVKARADAVDAHNASLDAQIASLRDELAALPEPTEGNANVVTELQARIGKGELLLARARTHWQAVETYKAAKQAWDDATDEVVRLEELCETFGPKGARVEALAQSVGAFEAQINQVTSTFGWTLKFETEPWGVTVNGRAVQTYSESEQFRIGIAMQLAIAVFSGLSFAIIDRLDMLDTENRLKVSEMLSEAPLDQILMLQTREPGVGLPSREGLIAYRLQKAGDRSEVAA